MWLLLASCAARGPSAPAETPPSAAAQAAPIEAPGDPGAEVGAADRLYRLLAGRWDTSRQAAEDKDYRSITLAMCPVEGSPFGERVLYVEQAVAAQPPYRQRVYRVVPGVDPAEAVTEIYELAHPESAAGWCDRGGPLDLSELTSREGCGARMRWEGARFVGGTHERDCVSDFRGATWTSSEIALTADRLDSWDRGWDDAGRQVWGAEKGPYRFERVSP